MWEIIVAIFESMTEKSVANAIFEWLESNAPKFARVVSAVRKGQQTMANVKKYLKYVDPQELLNMIRKMPQKMLDQFIQNKKGDLKADLQQAKDFTEWARTQKNIAERDFASMWEAYLGDGQTHNLSSSWIKTGKYTSERKGIGTLTIMVQQDVPKGQKPNKLYGPYTYPVVPLKTWNLMLQAKGRNGSGAGSVFWKLYLHGYIHSGIREAAYKYIFDVAQLKVSDPTIHYLAEVEKKVGSLQKNYYNRKNRTIAGAQDFSGWRKNTIKEFKDMENAVKGSVGQYKARYQKAKKIQKAKAQRIQSFNKKVEPIKKVKQTYNKVKRSLNEIKRDIKKRTF